MKTGKLFLIPNYIGNKEANHQFPLFNSEIVQSLKFFFVENPKPARAFIKSLNQGVNFDETELFHFDKHAKDNSEMYSAVLALLNTGNDVGVVSDAGCPGIADPGSEMVAWAHKTNITVVPLVGPSSIILTLMASGLNGQNFSFMGYLSKDQKERSDQIKKISLNIKNIGTTYIFIETPYKVESTFKDLLQFLSPVDKLCLGIDIFSSSQEIITKSIEGWKSMKPSLHLKDRQVVFAVG